MEKKKKISWQTAAGIFLFLAAVGMLFYSIGLCRGQDIWYDELFTEGFLSQDMKSMLSLAAGDVHPPLYYIIAKAVTTVLTALFPSVTAVTAAKFASVIPYALLLVYGVTFVRKQYGWFCAGLFSFCLMGMPQMASYTVEIRMYSWALFFVTATFFHASALAGEKENRFRKLHWFFFFLWGLAAAYTHYFAAAAVFFIYLWLFVFLAGQQYGEKSRKDFKEEGKHESFLKKSFLPWAVCAVLSVLVYLPWIFILLSQVDAVKKDYWILPLTWTVFGGCARFLLKPELGYDFLVLHAGWLNVLLAVLLFVVLAAALLFPLLSLAGDFRKEKRKKAPDGNRCEEKLFREKHVILKHFTEKVSFAWGGILILVMTALFGIAVSFLMRPIFVYRYLIPTAGCFWFGGAFLIGNLFAAENSISDGILMERGKKVRAKNVACAAVLLLIVFTGIVNFKGISGAEQWKANEMERLESQFQTFGEDDILVTNFNHVQGVCSYYLAQDIYLLGGEPEPLIANMYPNAKGMVLEPDQRAEQIRKWLGEGRKVWFLGSGQNTEGFVNEFAEYGIQSVQQDTYLLEQYWITLYELTEA